MKIAICWRFICLIFQIKNCIATIIEHELIVIGVLLAYFCDEKLYGRSFLNEKHFGVTSLKLIIKLMILKIFCFELFI